MAAASLPSTGATSSTLPLRVLLVDLATRFGGPETRVLSQATALQGTVEHCAVAVARGSPLHERLTEAGIPSEPIAPGRADPRILLELRRVIRSGRYQVVDAHNIQSIVWGHLAAFLAGARGRVTTVHSDYGEEYRGLRSVAYPTAFAMIRPITREFVQVTEHLQENAERRGDGSRSTLIHNAVPVRGLRVEGTAAADRSQWGWESSDFVVAVVGRLYGVKGHAYAIDALARLSDLPRVKLLIVGDGPLRSELAERVATLGLTERVRFLGYRADVPRILESVDCVCLPSLWELLPYAALEGAAHALPIIATSVGGVPRMLADGETALLVPPADAAALADAIRSLATHPDEALGLGRAAQAMVRSSFSVEEMLRKTLEVYRRSVG
ncbi:MAG TPA: glycosyltransferase family 4 protein [Longimicrobiaceae bacterium]